jgi:hypothetical protein
VPSFYSRLSDARGGNAMGLAERLPPGGPNGVNILFGIDVLEDENRAAAERLTRRMTEETEAFAREEGLFVGWGYMAYADESRNPYESNGGEAQRIVREAAEKYDPAGVFHRQVPKAFKIDRA